MIETGRFVSRLSGETRIQCNSGVPATTRRRKPPWRNPYAPQHILFFGTSAGRLQRKSTRSYDSRDKRCCHSPNNCHNTHCLRHGNPLHASLNLPPPLSIGFARFREFRQSLCRKRPDWTPCGLLETRHIPWMALQSPALAANRPFPVNFFRPRTTTPPQDRFSCR